MNYRLCTVLALLIVASLRAEPPNPERLTRTEWARNPMLQDPVAFAFDHRGGAYIVESARRSTVDIDIRAHKKWLLEDLANDDFESMRDFFRRKMATARSDENKSWLKDRTGDGIHDYHDLTTISERIRYLADSNGDGTADISTVFADQFQEEFTGVAAGVLPVDGDVLFTVYPDLWKLRDKDGDKRADERISLFRGFGVHAAFDGHDLHGLTIGPEGKVYFSCGDNGFSVINKEGKRLHYPNTGGILRMNRDGSNLEVFAYGLRNVQEFDFDQFGNMFGVDNDGDLEDERERAVYIAEGSDSGWRLHWQFRSEGWRSFNGNMVYNPWTAEGMWKPAHTNQPAYITPPMQNYSVGPGGFKFNPGTAINDDYRDFFFCIQFPVAKITAFRTQADGAGFRMVDEHLFHGGLMASSVNFGPDGGFFVADWVGKWQPNGEGVIYRFDDPAVAGSPLRTEVRSLLHDGVASTSATELAQLLGHQDRRIRQLAQSELVQRDNVDLLLQIAAAKTRPQLARIHALWGLIQWHNESESPRRTSVRNVATQHLPWSDVDPRIRQQCARVAGDLQLTESLEFLLTLLQDPDLLVQSHAAIAMGKLSPNETRTQKAFLALVELLAKNADSDPFIRHATVMGLAGVANADQLANLVVHDSESVRLGAVLALRRQRSEKLIPFLKDPDLRVRREAVRAVHDDASIPTLLPDVAMMLDDSDVPQDEPILRRVLSANLRVGSQQAATRIVRFIVDPTSVQDPKLAETLQVEALRILEVWGDFPIVDRVEGKIRQAKVVSPVAGRHVLSANLERILSSAGAEVVAEVTRIATNLKLTIDSQQLLEWTLSMEQPAKTRVGALYALRQQIPDTGERRDSFVRLLQKLSADQVEPVRHVAFRLLMQFDPSIVWNIVQAKWSSASVSDRQLFVSLLPEFELEQATKKLNHLVKRLANSDVEAELMLDVFHAAKASKRYKNELASITASLADVEFGEYEWALHGGDPSRGERTYKTHATAQCVRCHDAGGKGKQAGPELDGIARRVNRRQLLEAIVDPDARIADGYRTVTLIVDDGRVLMGTIVREDPEVIVIATSEAKLIQISADEVIERRENKSSAMPNMTKILDAFEVRDLVAYLATLTQ